MAEEQKPQKGKINIELSEEMSDGIYSNLAVITHSNSEFVVDFIRVMPGVPKAKVKSRIILTPQHAKRLMGALNENIRKFETQNGPIKEIKGMDQVLPMNFSGPQGEA
ncbi:MAG: DUF3467 domain-containing protein [Flavobacteriales bacterium]|jgi:hypothetical protein|uniref:DUF3467 domain-containing protein n=1 Tax=uncultured Polaribacter sp. TaxID=174711 RepID=UPI0030AAF038|tara:strand:+ start:21 stop:344 length:324 start_codon:yes stop_codon:yes gene_type:complete